MAADFRSVDEWGMMRIGGEPSPYFSASTPPRVSRKGVDKKTRRAILGLSLAQTDTPSQNFSAKDRIFCDKTAVVMRAWKFWLLITLKVPPTKSEN
jgi:hypothetical protein